MGEVKMNSLFKKLRLFFPLFILLFLISNSFADEYLVTNVPKTKRFKFSIGNVTVGNPGICDYRTNRKNKSITLYPKRAGDTLLLVYDTSGVQRAALQITVYPTDPEKLLNRLRTLLINVEGIKIERIDQKIVIDGEVYTQEDKDRIKTVIGQSSNVIDLSKLNSNTERIIAKKIEKEINLDEVSVRALKGKYILEGEVYSKQSKERAQAIAQLYSNKIINVLEVRTIPRPPSRANTVQITAHFIEISKNFAKNLNFKYNPFPNLQASGSYSFNPVTSSSTYAGTLSGTVNDLLPKINYYKALGIARVLENPTISVKSGSDATIESGSQVGFLVTTAEGKTEIQFQNVGLTLKITPFAKGSDIDIAIDLTVSALGSPDIQGSIIIDKSVIKTQQFVRSGESIVLGGVIRYSVRNILDRPPPTQPSGNDNNSGASSDPFALGSLFTLFKSSDYGKQRSQFIIFLTPTILKYAKDANMELKEQFNLYEVYPSGNYKPMTE